MSPLFLFLPFAAQGAVMAVDEFYFHARRGLGRWERIGHPLDTLTYFTTLAIPLLVARTPLWTAVFAVCALFSCLLITKDEWVHARECEPLEHWLHSLLFVLHPICLLAAGALWPQLQERASLHSIFSGFLASIFGFMLYQFFYWNFGPKVSRAHS